MTIKALFPASRPSLDLNFAKTKRLDPRITFSRSSTATYYGSDGLIKSAAVNEARFDHSPTTGESLGLLVEEARTNLVLRSQGFDNASWTKTNATVTANAAVAPDETMTAGLLVPTTTSGFHYVTQTIGSTVERTFSVFAKAAGYSKIWIGTFADITGPNIIIDLSTQTVLRQIDTQNVTVQDIGRGWYRISGKTTNSSSARDDIYVGVISPASVTFDNWSGDGYSGIYIWGAQLETGSFPTFYIPTPATFTGRTSTATFYDSAGVVQTAASGVARSAAFFPDSSGVMRPAGLLLEAAGTNLVTYSQEFDNAAWAKNAVTITANATTAPDGTTSADKAVVDTGASSWYVIQTLGTSPSTSSCTVYAKAAGWNYVSVGRGFVFGSGDYAIFDLQTGSVSRAPTYTGSTASIVPVGNGWYRCTLVSSQTENRYHVTPQGIGSSVNGGTPNGTSGVFLWGAQLEASPYPTSYIPTVASTVTRSADTSTSATVTRSADVASITGTNFSSWYNQSESTVLSLVRNVPFGGGLWYFGPTGAPRWWTRYETGNGVRTQAYDGSGGSGQVDIVVSGAGTNITLPSVKHAVAISNTLQQHAGSANGSTVVTGTWDNITGVSALALGIRTDNGSYLNGTVSRLTYYPARLPDATLQALTAS